jgi:hypothetical protein
MKKVIILSAAIFLLAAGCGKAQPERVNKPVSQSANQQVSVPANQPSQAPLASPQPVAKAQIKSKPDIAAPDVNTFTVYEIVDGPGQNQSSYQASSTENAFRLLSLTHKVQATSYSGIGEFVSSIDGTASDSKHFWEFFVNGKSSNVGASTYVLKSGDSIEWKLSAISSSGQ